MYRLHYNLVDVFTDQRFGGNPLAVFPNGRDVPPEIMPRIAKELNLSETTFVLPPDDEKNNWKVRIFTPVAELPMAGHPTVGTAFVLAQKNLVQVSDGQPNIRLEEKVGVIPVTFSFDKGLVSTIKMQQPNPTFGPEVKDRATVADMLSLTEADLDDYPVEQVTTGVPFLFVPIKTKEAVGKIKARPDVIERVLNDLDARMVFVFTRETVHPTSTVHSRMFGHLMGVPEDPATGAGSGPLGSYLVKHGMITANPATIISEQGIEMGRPSFIYIEVGQTNGAIDFVTVGGQCVSIGEGFIEIE